MMLLIGSMFFSSLAEAVPLGHTGKTVAFVLQTILLLAAFVGLIKGVRGGRSQRS
jgi:hypothetical protein